MHFCIDQRQYIKSDMDNTKSNDNFIKYKNTNSYQPFRTNQLIKKIINYKSCIEMEVNFGYFLIYMTTYMTVIYEERQQERKRTVKYKTSFLSLHIINSAFLTEL